LCIEFQDNGAGISPEHIGQVFDPFFTTKDIGEGTGLGLSVSYGIVKDHGGEIRVQSELGSFTRFSILLPTDRQKDAVWEKRAATR
jgi:signal transduction histidine kinase